MKRIGINLLFLIPGEVGGTENYSRLLIEGLMKTDRKNTYFIFCNQETKNSLKFISPKWHMITCEVHGRNRVSRVLFEQLVLPLLLWRYRCDVVHSLGYLGPVFTSSERLVTVHDANWLDCPEDVSLPSRLMQSLLTPLSMLTARFVITDSEFSKFRLETHFPGVAKKLKVISPWISSAFQVAINNKIRLPKLPVKYLLCVSGLYPHKRILYLLKLFAHQQMSNLNLVLVGKNGADETQVRQLIKTIPNISYFHSVSLPVLVELYRRASAFLFPSIYEGFGYPVFEAQSFGLPTVVGRKSLYPIKLQSSLMEFIFKPQKDIALMKGVMQKTRKLPTVVFKEKESVHSLLSLYESL